ncbi:hypothetical protein ID866_6342 [Astraeus odoratus]|nr:hypothetical protein ID866_6342 [Astraeus odoratus]
MVIIPSEKPDVSHTLEIDQPPAYDTITPQPPNQSSVPNGTAPSVAAVASSSPNLTLPSPSPTQSPSDSDHSLSLHRSGSDLRASTITIRTGRARLQKPRKRPSSSWLSLLPFTNARSAKQVRKSVLATIRDLVVLPGHPHISAPPDPYEVLSSCANTCAERRLSLSEILQEPSVADHTPIYWAIVNYRGPLLVALLTFAGQLGPDAVSDVRRACLNPFVARRYARASQYSGSIYMTYAPQHPIRSYWGHSLQMKYWSRRMRAVGRTSVEFIASGDAILQNILVS